MQGKIIKGIAGFYYVHDGHSRIYECKAKGIFRNQKIKPLVGDDVEIAVLDESEALGNIEAILPRQNVLIRPAVSNVDQAVVFFASAEPTPNFNLLDRFLVMMERQQIPILICFNKVDLVSSTEVEELASIYGNTEYTVIFTSTYTDRGIQEIKEQMLGKTSVLAGPSGAGKSSLTNLIFPKAEMKTGILSEKIKRGKHTTRHSELFFADADTYIMDTPGFSSIYIEDMECEELKNYFLEFEEFQSECRYLSCNHVAEPKCGVKDAVSEGTISKVRYQNYLTLYTELKDKRRY